MKNAPRPAAALEHIVIWIMAPLVMAACSGGSSNGGISGSVSVKALLLPDRIELPPIESQRAVGRAAHDEAGDDSRAAGHTWMDDTDVLDMVNGILNIVKETGYAGFVNQGPYTTVVRQADKNRQRPSSGGTISTTAGQRMEIYVEVTRTGNSSPMIVKVWVKDNEGPGPGATLVRGYFSVTQGVSATYPYGVMFVHFKGTVLDSEGNKGPDMFAMAMSVGAGGGNVVQKNVGDGSQDQARETRRRTRMAANVNMSEGHAYFYEAETDWGGPGLPNPATRQAAFNAGYSRSTEECRDPDFYARDDLRHGVFRYPLFDADAGSAVTRASDFPFEALDSQHG